MTGLTLRPPVIRAVVGGLLAAAVLAVLVPRDVDDPDLALQRSVASALATNADDGLLQVALDQYPERAPAIAITYGHLELFRRQLARFGPQVVPIVAAYQHSLTTADVVEIAGKTVRSVGRQLAGRSPGIEPAPLAPEARGLIALLKMRDEGNAFVGQWEITENGEARRIPSRLVTLAGPEILIGGLTALERDLIQEKEIAWQTWGLAAVDVAAIASGVALLRFARTVARGRHATAAVARTATPRSGALAAARVLGINAVKYGLPIGLVALMALHPGVYTHYLWVLAESLGLPGILGPIVGWGMVIVPLSLLVSWTLLSVRVLRLGGWLFARIGRGCRHLALRLAAPP